MPIHAVRGCCWLRSAKSRRSPGGSSRIRSCFFGGVWEGVSAFAEGRDGSSATGEKAVITGDH